MVEAWATAEKTIERCKLQKNSFSRSTQSFFLTFLNSIYNPVFVYRVLHFMLFAIKI